MITLKIPAPLRAYTTGKSQLTLSSTTVEAAMVELIERFPDLKPHLFGDDKQLRSFVNLFVNGEDIRSLNGTATVLGENDRLMIIPSIAGG